MQQSRLNCWVDSHCHLDFPRFDEDRDAVLARARAVNVNNFVVPGISAASWQRTDGLESESGVHLSFGLHPWWSADHRPEHVDLLKERLVDSQAVAVGECGLDNSCNIDMNKQRHWFQTQLHLAADLGLPVIVHAVHAIDEVLREITAFPRLTGVIHSFAGSRQQADRCIKAGLMLGIGPDVLRSSKLRGVLADIPLDSLLLETDAPDRPVIGTRGEPAHIVKVGEVVATVKQVLPEELARRTSANARKLFGWGNT